MKTQSYMNVSYFVVVSMLSFILDPHPKKIPHTVVLPLILMGKYKKP